MVLLDLGYQQTPNNLMHRVLPDCATNHFELPAAGTQNSVSRFPVRSSIRSLIVLHNPLVRFRTWMSRATRMNTIVTARSTPPSTRGEKTEVPDTAALKKSTR